MTDMLVPDLVTTTDDRAVLAAAFAGTPCHVSGLGVGGPHPLPMQAWRAAADRSDHAVLDHCAGATLDVGCGPGRMTEALTATGARVLGVDIVPEAVALTRARGARALLRDVFDRVPDEGRWDTALLADGNIGIGGDPVTLLRRVHDLLAPGGRVVVDVAPPGTATRTATLTLVCAGRRSSPFRWSLVGADAVRDLAAEARLTTRLSVSDDRWVAVLGRGRP